MRDIILWAISYTMIGGAFFGVIASVVEEEKYQAGPGIIFLASLIWPLTLIAAISYSVSQWLAKR